MSDQNIIDRLKDAAIDRERVIVDGQVWVRERPEDKIVEKLFELAALKTGDPMPDWLPESNWGPPLSELAKNAAVEIRRQKRRTKELANYKQAASVEAGLRREAFALVIEMRRLLEKARPFIEDAWRETNANYQFLQDIDAVLAKAKGEEA